MQAGFLSIVVSIFIVDSYKQLMSSATPGVPDSQTSHNQTSWESTRSVASPARSINRLWFASLVLSLVTALLAILTKQWLASYHLPPTLPDSQSWAHLHQFRSSGIDKWHVSTILSLLPILLHTALFLFICGLPLMLFELDKPAAIIVCVILGLAFGFYLVSTLLPFFRNQCPYKTPAYYHILAFMRTLRDIWDRAKDRFGHDAIHSPRYDPFDPLHRESHALRSISRDTMDHQCLDWMIVRAASTPECVTVIQAVGAPTCPKSMVQSYRRRHPAFFNITPRILCHRRAEGDNNRAARAIQRLQLSSRRVGEDGGWDVMQIMKRLTSAPGSADATAIALCGAIVSTRPGEQFDQEADVRQFVLAVLGGTQVSRYVVQHIACTFGVHFAVTPLTDPRNTPREKAVAAFFIAALCNFVDRSVVPRDWELVAQNLSTWTSTTSPPPGHQQVPSAFPDVLIELWSLFLYDPKSCLDVADTPELREPMIDHLRLGLRQLREIYSPDPTRCHPFLNRAIVSLVWPYQWYAHDTSRLVTFLAGPNWAKYPRSEAHVALTSLKMISGLASAQPSAGTLSSLVRATLRLLQSPYRRSISRSVLGLAPIPATNHKQSTVSGPISGADRSSLLVQLAAWLNRLPV